MGLVMRILSTTVMLALLLSSGAAAPVAAVGEVTVSINAPANVASGDNFTATVDISQVANLDAFNYDVSFDPTVLRLDNVTSGNISGTIIPVDFWTENVTGTYKIVQDVPGLASINGTGYLAVLRFHVVGSSGQSSSITLSDGALSNTLAQEIPATWVGDSVQVTTVDTAPPTVIATSPIANATGVAINTTIRVTFSEAMNTTSAQSAFSISPTVSGSRSWNFNNDVMTFTPAANLSCNKTYTVTIGTGAKDLVGLPLANAYIWSFTTLLPPPWSATMTASTPTHGSNSLLVFGNDGTDPYQFEEDWDHAPSPDPSKFDAYFIFPNPDHDRLDEDHRAPAITIQWTLHAFAASQAINLTWGDISSSVPQNVLLKMTGTGGPDVKNMKAVPTINLPGGSYTLIITATTITPPT